MCDDTCARIVVREKLCQALSSLHALPIALVASTQMTSQHFKQELREYHSHDGEKGGKDRIQKNGLATPMPAHSFHRHTLPVRLGCVGCSFQCKKT